MRRSLPLLALVLLFPICRATPPAPLDEAIRNTGNQWERWAYTETTVVKSSKGRNGGPTVVRFDPSKPYAEQFVPLQINGKPPTPRQLAQYRERGIKRGESLAREAERPPRDDAHATFAVNNQTADADFEQARLLNDTGTSLVYEVPLRGKGKHPLPADKLQLIVTVNRERHELERGTIRLVAPVRHALIAKIKSGRITMDFAKVDPSFPPVLVATRGDIALTLFFVNVGGSSELTRTDFKHVKPYDERFAVKVGPLRAFGF